MRGTVAAGALVACGVATTGTTLPVACVGYTRAGALLAAAVGAVDFAAVPAVVPDRYTGTGALFVAGVGVPECWVAGLNQLAGRSRAQNRAIRLQISFTALCAIPGSPVLVTVVVLLPTGPNKSPTVLGGVATGCDGGVLTGGVVTTGGGVVTGGVVTTGGGVVTGGGIVGGAVPASAWIERGSTAKLG